MLKTIDLDNNRVQAIEICEHLGFCLGNAIESLFDLGEWPRDLPRLQRVTHYFGRALAGNVDYSVPPPELVLRVRAAEPPDAVLRQVLEALFCREDLNFYARVKLALERVETEIKVRSE